MSHSVFSPSAAHRWMRCTASIGLEAGLPDKGSRDADEGTAAHELAAVMLRGAHVTSLDDARAAIGEQHRQYVDDAMLEHVTAYRDYVMAAAAQWPGALLLVEQQLDMSHIAPGVFGTGDVVLLHAESRWGKVIDLKYGRGVEVDAENNEQLKLYASGAHALAELLGYEVDQWRVEIFQPRVSSTPRWDSFTVEHLDTFTRLAAAVVQNIQAGKVSFAPGEKQCRWCRAKGICRARADEMLALAQREFSTQPSTLTEQDLADLLPQLDRFSDWVKDVWEAAEQALAAGKAIPGWKLVEGRSVRKWRPDAHFWLEKMLQGDAFKPRELIGIPEAEKLLGKLAIEIPAELITKPPGKPAIAPESDKRPAVSTATPADDFTAVSP